MWRIVLAALTAAGVLLAAGTFLQARRFRGTSLVAAAGLALALVAVGEVVTNLRPLDPHTLKVSGGVLAVGAVLLLLRSVTRGGRQVSGGGEAGTPGRAGSAPRRRPADRPRVALSQAGYLAAGAGLFVALVAAGAVAKRLPPLKGLETAEEAAAVPEAPEWYLAYGYSSLDHHTLYHNFNDAAVPLKKADVLFLGHSRTLFALPQEVLAPFFRERGLSYYVMAFAYGESNQFPEALIRKYDLRPKWVVINADPFFWDNCSPPAKKAMADGCFDVWKYRLETRVGFEARRRLHRVVPALMRPTVPTWVFYRSYQDGTLRLAGYKGIGGPVPDVLDAARLPKDLDHAVAEAGRFKEEMAGRGARVVLTSVPPGPTVYARTMSERLHVPAVLPTVPGLMTCDGTHLTAESARRYSRAFLSDLGRVLDE
jgi:hypothetical protein